CSFNDTCDGSGLCVGTALTCTSDQCNTRTCNGTSSCTVTPLTGTSCDDGDACSFNDTCDGSGQCVGTALTCTSDQCNTRTCDGNAAVLADRTGVSRRLVQQRDGHGAPPATSLRGGRRRRRHLRPSGPPRELPRAHARRPVRSRARSQDDEPPRDLRGGHLQVLPGVHADRRGQRGCGPGRKPLRLLRDPPQPRTEVPEGPAAHGRRPVHAAAEDLQGEEAEPTLRARERGRAEREPRRPVPPLLPGEGRARTTQAPEGQRAGGAQRVRERAPRHYPGPPALPAHPPRGRRGRPCGGGRPGRLTGAARPDTRRSLRPRADAAATALAAEGSRGTA